MTDSKVINFISINPKDVGINFTHKNGHINKFKYPEIMGSGVAVLDFDLDGDLDLYFVQSGNGIESDQLYKSLLSETGELIFVNFTKELNISQTSYGFGVSVGDYNNDGYPDIYLSNLKKNVLLKNHNGEYFIDESYKIHVSKSNYLSIGSTFVDLNLDGWLDLVSINNIKYLPKFEQECKHQLGLDYCGPSSYSFERNIIFKNDNGLFFEIDDKHSITTTELPSLAVSIFDYNADGLPDIYIANDEQVNALWANQDNFHFAEDNALEVGLAVNSMAKAEASMGVAMGDIDKNGLLDLFLSHMWRETNTLYMQNDIGEFFDETNQYNLAKSSYKQTGFGVHFLDFENDGDLDVVVANGSVLRTETSNYKNGYSEFNLFYENIDRNFKKLDNGTILSKNIKKNSRGLIRVDLDNDGDSDIIISNNNDIPEIYLNQQDFSNNWVGYIAKNKDGLIQENNESIAEFNGHLIHNIQTRTGSYASSSDPRVLMGLGQYSSSVTITVRWNVTEFEKFILTPNKYHELIQGEGQTVLSWPISSNSNSFKDGNNLTDSITNLLDGSISNASKLHIKQLIKDKAELELCYSLQSYEFINQASICYEKYLSVSINTNSDDYYLATINEINKFNYSQARIYIDIALENQKANWFYCYRKSQILFLDKKYEQADLQIKQCKSKEQHIFNIQMAGDIAFQKKHYKTAFKRYREVLTLKPEVNHVYYQLADSLKIFNPGKLEQLARSKAGKTKLILNDPINNILISYNKDPEYFFKLSLFTSGNGHLIAALNFMKRAYELDSNNEKIIRLYALLLIRNNKLLEALKIFSRHQTELSQVESYIAYGTLLIEVKQIKKSQDVFAKALKLFPEDIKLLTSLADLYFRLEEFKLAENYYTKILKLDPENMTAHEKLKLIEGSQ